MPSRRQFGTPRRSAWIAAALTLLLAASGPAVAAVLDRHRGEAQLSRAPTLVPGPGCVTGSAGFDGGSRYQANFTCAGLPLVVTVLALPPRSTPDQLVQAERELAGEDEAQDSQRSTLTVSRSDVARWRLTTTVAPTRATALAAWIGGRPVEGGLSTRIRQAWASLSGGATAPILVAVQVSAGAEHLTAQAEASVKTLLTQFLDAQPGLPGSETSP